MSDSDVSKMDEELDRSLHFQELNEGLCVYCHKEKKSAGSSYCGSCIDNGNYLCKKHIDYCTCSQRSLSVPIGPNTYECFDCGKEILNTPKSPADKFHANQEILNLLKQFEVYYHDEYGEYIISGAINMFMRQLHHNTRSFKPE